MTTNPAAVAQLLLQYGCGPIPSVGEDNALYERHLVFDRVIDPKVNFLVFSGTHCPVKTAALVQASNSQVRHTTCYVALTPWAREVTGLAVTTGTIR
jgi:hypothetical protein